MQAVTEFAIAPKGPFSLAAAQDFAGGFPAGIGGGAVGETSIVMAFPIEGTNDSAAVELRQEADGRLVARSDVSHSRLAAAERQAARSLSVDHDGSDWPAVGDRDPVIGRLQSEYRYLRPVCFYSAYEAATSFVIGQRIARRQGARIKAWLAESFGDRPTVDGQPYPAFPRPERLLEVGEAAGLSQKKLGWLHGLARAALEGRLQTEELRALPRADAIERLCATPGIGPFTAEGTWLRGCGLVDELPTAEAPTLQAVSNLYDRPDLDSSGLAEIAELWRPYRMWAVVLLRVGWGRSVPPRSYRSG
jgi:DNA-3-methyladenine glycosylase II